MKIVFTLLGGSVLGVGAWSSAALRNKRLDSYTLSRSRRSSSDKDTDETEYANPLTAIVGSFLPREKNNDEAFEAIDWGAAKVRGLPLEELVRQLDKGLMEREWFVTGKVLPQYFSEDFEFKDPDVQLTGIREYAEGVRRIFDQASARAEVVSCSAVSSPEASAAAFFSSPGTEGAVIDVVWRLSGRVNVGPFGGLELKPYMVTSRFLVEASSGLVVRQEDVFSLPSYDILLSALLPPGVVRRLPFLAPPAPPPPPRPAERPAESGASTGRMKRPFLDSVATALFKLETGRVAASSEVDASGRPGEPMAWAESGSLANKVSEAMASGPGHAFKQAVADLVAGEHDKDEADRVVAAHAELSASPATPVTLFSFTTCPFCRKAKDYLDSEGIAYVSLELDEREDGNALRAALGRQAKRTSVPAVFVKGAFVGGCNDGPGLLPLAKSGELAALLAGGRGA